MINNLIDKLDTNGINVHILYDSIRLDVQQVYVKKSHTGGLLLLKCNTLCVMHGEDVVHVGNLDTIEEFVLSLE